MSQIMKQIIIQQLFHSTDIQDLIKEFLFYTEKTSPSKNRIRKSKDIINTIFISKTLSSVVYMYPVYLQIVNPVTRWRITISSKYTGKRYNHGFVLTGFNCQRCGDYYKEECSFGKRFRRDWLTSKIIPKQIECNCFHYSQI